MLPTRLPSFRKTPHRFKFLTCRRTPSARRWAIVATLAMTLSGNTAPLFFTPENGVVHAQATAAVGFVLNAGDIRFIFRQIQIAQEHAAGNPLLGLGPLQVSDPRLPFGLRTVDGSFNHLVDGQTRFGSSDQLFPRLAPPLFRDAENATTYKQNDGTVIDAQPRIISNLIVDQKARNPTRLKSRRRGTAAPRRRPSRLERCRSATSRPTSGS